MGKSVLKTKSAKTAATKTSSAEFPYQFKVNKTKGTVTIGLTDFEKLKKRITRLQQQVSIKASLTRAANDVSLKIKSKEKQKTLGEFLDAL